MKTLDFYKQTSQFTFLGKYKEEAIDLWENKCNKSLKNLCWHLMNVTVHKEIIKKVISGYNIRNYGDFNYIDYTTPMCEDDVFLTASSMFCEIFRRDEKGFYLGRPTKHKLVLTCRYISVLTSAILRANGIPCRCRAGWAKYLRHDGQMVDHWVNEYWNEKENRWIMIDMDDLYDEDFSKYDLYIQNNISKEYLDIKGNQFITASEAWLIYRKDTKFLDSLKYDYTNCVEREVLKYLFLDFYAIMNFEANYKFFPMAFEKDFDSLTQSELEEIDELAILMYDVDSNFGKLKDLYDNTPKYRMLTSPLVPKNYFEPLIKSKGYTID